MSSSHSSGAPELFEVICGSPRARTFKSTGIEFECRPHLPSGSKSRVLPWMWFWRLRFSASRVLYGLAVLELIASVIIFIELVLWAGVTGAIVFIIVFNLFVTAPMVYAGRMANWNFRLREGVCWCLGKSAQARAQWAYAPSQEDAKQVFFEWKVSRGFKLVVLNDGTRETWNTTGDDLSPQLNNALCLAGFNGSHLDSNTTARLTLNKSEEEPPQNVQAFHSHPLLPLHHLHDEKLEL